MNFQKINAADKKNYLDLLLLGDEQEDMIDRYLQRGTMYALDDGGVKCVCVVTDEGEGILEIKNIAVLPEAQRMGYGRRMIECLERVYKGKYSVVQAGTGDSPSTVPFYEKCGFVRSHTVPNFFIENYDHPIFEDGVQLVDMVYFRKVIEDQKGREMKMKAIVYTSNTGHTAEYAKILGEKIGLPVYELNEATKTLGKGTAVIYLGWLFANSVKGYKIAVKFFDISAVCAVGLCDTGTAIDNVRKVNSIPESLPVFTMQGGMDKKQLYGINKFMIGMLMKMMLSKKERTEDDARMIYLLENDKDYVCEENTVAFMEWYRGAL